MSEKMISDRTAKRFIEYVGKLEIDEFLGLARLLKVKVFDEEKKDENGEPETRAFDDVMGDVCEAFFQMDRKKRKDLMKILKAATQEGD